MALSITHPMMCRTVGFDQRPTECRHRLQPSYRRADKNTLFSPARRGWVRSQLSCKPQMRINPLNEYRRASHKQGSCRSNRRFFGMRTVGRTPRLHLLRTGPSWAVDYQWLNISIIKPPFRLLCCHSPFRHSHRVFPHSIPRIHTQHQLKVPDFAHRLKHSESQHWPS